MKTETALVIKPLLLSAHFGHLMAAWQSCKCKESLLARAQLLIIVSVLPKMPLGLVISPSPFAVIFSFRASGTGAIPRF